MTLQVQSILGRGHFQSLCFSFICDIGKLITSKLIMKREEKNISVTEKEDILNLISLNPEIVDDFAGAIDSLAESFLNGFVIRINGKDHRLAEVEFYLQDENHNDIFTHCDEQQKIPCQWYFHRMGKGATAGYKGGSYKGLDITFSKRGFGGMLIRALYQIETKEYIEGPSKVVDHILSLCSAKDISSFTTSDNFSWSVLDETKKLHIVQSKLERRDLITSGRVGLVLRKKEHVPFVLKPYRYMSFPLLVRKGRQHLVLELYYIGKTKEEIMLITGCTGAAVGTYIQHYNASKAKPKLASAYFDTKTNSEEFCKFYQVLRTEADRKEDNI